MTIKLNEQTPVDVRFHQIQVTNFVPHKWTRWRHNNGTEYIVYDITNENTNKYEKFPVTVSYYDPEKKVKYSRKARDWVIFIAAEDWSFDFVRHCTPEEIASLKEELWNV